jgi:hypothetical protein
MGRLTAGTRRLNTWPALPSQDQYRNVPILDSFDIGLEASPLSSLVMNLFSAEQGWNATLKGMLLSSALRRHCQLL